MTDDPRTWRLTYGIVNTRFRGRADVRLLGEYAEGAPNPNPWALLPQDNGPTLAVAIDRLIAEEPNSPVQIMGAHNADGDWLLGLYGLEHCTDPDQAHRAVDVALGVVRAVQEEIRVDRGGRRHGWRKGNQWDRDAFQGWKSDRDLEGKPATLPALADALGVKDPETAHQRLRDLDPPLRWPPEKYPADWDPYLDPDDE